MTLKNSFPSSTCQKPRYVQDFGLDIFKEGSVLTFQGEFLCNYKGINFGVRHCGSPVEDVELPPWASGPADFVTKLREALESEHVSLNLHGWIDLIFGYKQRGIEAEKADNVFYHLCYEGSVNVDSVKALEERYALDVQIGEFGQIPKQLFKSPHPQRRRPQVPRSLSSGDADAVEVDGVDVEALMKFQADREPGVINDDEINSWNNIEQIRRVCDYKVGVDHETSPSYFQFVGFKVHREALSVVAISVDNLWVMSASHDDILKFYSLEEMQVLRTVNIPSMAITTCLPLPNNKTVLVGSGDNHICSYSIETSRASDFLCIHRLEMVIKNQTREILSTLSGMPFRAWTGVLTSWSLVPGTVLSRPGIARKPTASRSVFPRT